MYTNTYHMCQLVQILMTLLQKKKIEGMMHLLFYDVACDWLQEEWEAEQDSPPLLLVTRKWA